MPSRAVTVVMIDERMRSGAKAAMTITSVKNGTNAFPATADAPIDELNLKHALPLTPQEQSFQSRPQYGDALSHFEASEREGGSVVVVGEGWSIRRERAEPQTKNR